MMKKLALPVVLFTLAGCSSIDQGPQGEHDVSWYLHHQKKMTQEVTWCKNSADRSGLDSCQNANKAQDKALAYNANKTLHSLGKKLS